MDTVIITDSGCDLPLSFIEQNNVPVIRMTFHFKGKDYTEDSGKSMDFKEFYDGVREGELSTTSQINAFTFAEEFKNYVRQNKSIIYIGFSSALSGSLNSAVLAKDMVLKEYSSADISIIDSKSASTGQGLLVYYAYEMLKSGKTKEEIVNWLEENKLKVNHWFTVDDLHHLKRGGRVSGASAFIGTILDIKPVLHVDDEGRLIPITKVKGRRKSLRMLADKFKEMAVNPEEQVVFISHGDALGDAELLRNMILESSKVKDIVITYIGPVIGTHSGPGTIALFFMGNKR